MKRKKWPKEERSLGNCLSAEQKDKLIGGIKVLVKAEILQTKDWEYPWENMPDHEVKGFSRTKSVKVVQDFIPYLSEKEADDIIKFGEDFMVKFYRSREKFAPAAPKDPKELSTSTEALDELVKQAQQLNFGYET